MSTTILAIYLLKQFKNIFSTFIVDVYIYVWERRTPRNKEPFEKQVMFQRVNLGNAQAITNKATSSRTTSRTDPYVKL